MQNRWRQNTTKNALNEHPLPDAPWPGGRKYQKTQSPHKRPSSSLHRGAAK